MKAVISGKSGFLGKALTEKLENQGIEVIGIPRELLTQKEELNQFFHRENPDYIFHLATHGNMADHDDIDLTWVVNAFGIYTMLAASQQIPYKAFINISSSSVLLPRSTVYSAGKAAAESLCKAWVDMYGKPIVSIRPSSITGVGEQESHLIPKLIDSCLTGEQIPFVPEPTHDFIDVSDVVSALLILKERAEDYKGLVFNVSSNKSYSNQDVKELVEKLTGKNANVKIKQTLRSYDTPNWIVNNKNMKALGWKPKVSLILSLVNMIRVSMVN